MSKDKDEKDEKDKNEKDEKDSKSWSYDGSEDDWDTFDRKMTRYMSKKYDTLGEKIWLGTIPDIALIDGQEYIDYCTEDTSTIALRCGMLSTRMILP